MSFPNSTSDIAERKEYFNNHMKGVGEAWKNDIKEVVFTEEQIKRKVKELAAQISEDYKGEKPLVVGLLKGCFVFLADLLREVTIPYSTDFMALSSYSGSSSTGSVKLRKDLDIEPAGRHILIVEDLIDTGRTLEWMKKHLSSKNCLSVKICCLLSKEERRVTETPIDYVGYTCPSAFVIGYGMDYNDDYRCLPFVGVLKESVYSSSD